MFPGSTSIRCLILILAIGVPAAAARSETESHVFILGDTVRVAVPDNAAGIPTQARALDEGLEELGRVAVANAHADFGPLPVGWCRVEFLAHDNSVLAHTTAAVLEPLAAPPPEDTPIAVDIALSWLGAKDQGDWARYARLARLAGVRWVRDRIHWREMQPEDGPFLDHTKYDDSAVIQAAEDLRILQVFHTRPQWALLSGTDPHRPQLDLAKLYRFCRGLAERFQGRVQAWEPWNEGNAANFGGLTMDELCSLQKAAWLGFKAADPDVTVCWNPLGGVNIKSQTEVILRNETWPYYDIYSIHSYDWPESFEELWIHARDAASGRPIWVTEADRGMTADPGSPVGDFTPDNDRRKAEFIAQSYVRSLYSGAARHFHFILGPYTEGEHRTQFGLLREDLTPRPSYVALAALGRLLAGADSLGRHIESDNPNVHIYAFRAKPGGEARDVLVAWAEPPGDWPERGKMRAPWPIVEPLRVEAAYDYLGRPLEAKPPSELSPAAVFLVLPEGESKKLALSETPRTSLREGGASPIVLQFSAPDHPPVQRMMGWSPEAAYEFAPSTTVDATIVVYNLSDQPVTGSVQIDGAPQGWEAVPQAWDVQLDPGESASLPLRVTLPPDPSAAGGWLDFHGDFGNSGKPKLAVWNRTPPKKDAGQ